MISNLAASINARSEKAQIYYFTFHFACVSSPYSDKNPEGGISMCIAENKLCGSLLLDKIREFNDFVSQSICYTDSSGHPPFKACIAEFIGKRIFKHDVDTNHIIIGAGCTSLLYQLSLMLFNSGEALLLPTPYYPVFDKDFMNLGQVYMQEVASDPEANFAFTLQDLDTAYASAVTAGHPPRALILTNPHNPLGTIFSRDFLLAAIAWCRQHKLHAIVDEIYALSTFGDSPFVSIVEALDGQLGDDVHVLWGLSKDIGSSGLRVGVLYTQNEALLGATKYIADAFQVPVLVQQMATSLLSDEAFMDPYLVENTRRLRKSYTHLQQALAAVGIPTIPAVSSIFAFVDLRSLLAEQTFAAERQLFEEICSKIGVVLTPGVCCHTPAPGFFRVCYAWVAFEELEVATKRLAAFVVEARKKEK